MFQAERALEVLYRLSASRRDGVTVVRRIRETKSAGKSAGRVSAGRD